MRFGIIVTAVFLLVAFPHKAMSQNPTYKLKVMNFIRTAPNELTFEIRMQHTNSPTHFEYAGGQYFFDFNKAIANGGTITYSYAQDTSELPLNMRPRNPTVYTATTPGQLRLAVNTFPSAGNGYINMSTSSPGTKILKMRISTSSSELSNVGLGLRWRDSIPGPFTKIFAFVGTTNTDISSRIDHSIDSSVLNPTHTIIKFGIEGLMRNGIHQVRDTVFVQFRSVFSPYSVIYSFVHVLDSISLTTIVNFPVSPSNYYIVIRNKNSLETWSKPGGEPLGYGTNFYDFTIAASQAYGGNLVLMNGLYCIYTGNVNGDGIIDAEDMLTVDNAVFNFDDGSSIANLNGDGIVDIDDLVICDRNARQFVIVQRP